MLRLGQLRSSSTSPAETREGDMYVRMGNSTRKLLTDEAFEYAKQRW